MSKDTNQVSVGEKLIIMMLSELYDHFDIKGTIDPEFIKKVIHQGHHWALDYEYPGIFHDEVHNPEDVEETVQILEMWRFIGDRYNGLSQEDKANIEKETGLKDKDFTFPGFDGNNDRHYYIADFLINELHRFTEINPINSHTAVSLKLYRRMLPVYKSIILNRSNESSADQIIRIFEAMDRNLD